VANLIVCQKFAAVAILTLFFITFLTRKAIPGYTIIIYFAMLLKKPVFQFHGISFALF